MRSNPSKFFPFEKPIYADLVFYLFLFISIQGMKQNLNDFYNYGDPTRLIPLLIDFSGSIFVAWIVAIGFKWVRDLVASKLKARNINRSTKTMKDQNINSLKITKLEKPLNEMTAEERNNAARDISEIMLEQAKQFKKDN